MWNDRRLGHRARKAMRFGVLGLLLMVIGDRGQALVDRGIDPLEVLDLQVKPNVIVVLDSSGSMQETVGGTDLGSGDHPRSKMYLAKQVLKQSITDNAEKATFLFGQYTQNVYNPAPAHPAAPLTPAGQDVGSRLGGQGRGGDRFRYVTNNIEEPSMATTELFTSGRGFQAFQEIRDTWNVLHFREQGTDCTITIPPGFYTPTALADELRIHMEQCSGPNTYAVTYNTSNGQFTFDRTGGGAAWTLRWSQTANSIGPVLNASSTDQTPGSGEYTTGDGIRLLRRGTGSDVTESFDYDGNGTLDSVTTYHVIAGRLFNGETLLVTSGGTVCGINASTATTNPPTVNLQQVSACNGTNVGDPVTFTFAGGSFGNNTVSCNGFQANVPLARCDQTSTQLDLIEPFLENEIVLTSDGTGIQDYAETTDGSYQVTSVSRPGITGGVKANGSTPIAASLMDIDALWGTASTGLWGAGQTTPAISAIKDHSDPKERTIVLFVTDGDDRCSGFGTDTAGIDASAKTAAYWASRLYERIDSNDPASSVTTYVIGFGSGASTQRLHWIAWGGSGLGAPSNNTSPLHVPTTGTDTPDEEGQEDTDPSQRWSDTTAQLQAKRDLCSTCIDAFIAPDADTLAQVIQSILDQGATLGEFTAQQSVTDSVFELVAEIPGTFQGQAFTPNDPDTRFVGIVPTLFRSSFKLPGFEGQLRAFTNENNAAFQRWNAGEVLRDTVRFGPGGSASSPGTGANGGTAVCNDGAAGECRFASLKTQIKRRIFTTSRNGVYPVSVANYLDSSWVKTNGNRVNLWPPAADVSPTTDTAGALDGALGLNDLVNGTETVAQQITRLKDEFGACTGTPLPTNCEPATADATELLAVKREAREITLAYMAGAEMVLANDGSPKRIPNGGNRGQILYKARSWVLADSTLGDAAVAPPVIDASPAGTGYGTEYELMRDGARTNSQVAANGVDIGLGLRNPDQDTSTPAGADTRTALKPAMTVVYLPANDMLHAFRAGPSVAATTAPPNCTRSLTVDCGGEELWGFVPFDQLDKLRERLRPQTRSNHTYMLASAMRFADVFVPNEGTAGNYTGTPQANTVPAYAGAPTATTPPMKGLWRRLIFFGRGIGGKYITAIDVTSPGPYTRTTKDAGTDLINGPIPLWSRGNPDTNLDVRGGADNYIEADKLAYAKMGETWSTPAIAHVNKLDSNRRPCPGTESPGTVCADQAAGGVQFVAFVGSGYGELGEGTTFYTLDALTGDVVASVDVGSRSGGVPGGYANALVADAVTFNLEEFVINEAEHPMNAKASRAYIGDLHGRVWKILASDPGTAIEFADLGADQPIATAVALLNLPPGATGTPHVFVTTGNDTRAVASSSTRFLNAGYRDDTPTGAGVELFTPIQMEPLFRGTIQPATAFTIINEEVLGRVFFGGTRFVPPPPSSDLSTPIGTSGVCRSRFDSIVYALGAETGLEAFDLNTGSEDDSFMILDNSRLAAITIIADTTAGGTGSTVHLDEGLGSNNQNTGCDNNKPTPKGNRPSLGSSSNVEALMFRQGTTACRQ